MVTNNDGIALLESLEGCRTKAYILAGEKYYTIGYGHSYDSSITANTVWSMAQCEAALKKDLAKFEKYVTDVAVKKFPNMNSNQFSALVSYTYNRGLGKSDGSSGLYQLVMHSSTLEELGKNIVVYWGSAQRYKTALIARRKKEQALFNKGTTVSTSATTTILPTVATATIRNGVKGENARNLQKDLNYVGKYGLKEDGDFGSKSVLALKDWQKKNGLTNDGVYGNKSYEKMKSLIK